MQAPQHWYTVEFSILLLSTNCYGWIFNPLIKYDRFLISLYSLTLESNVKLTRIKEMITN